MARWMPGRWSRPWSVVAASVAICLIVITAAIGYWSGTGSGTAATTLGNPQGLTLGPGTPSTRLSPGTSAAVATVASNPNPYPVQISSISLDTAAGSAGFAVDGGHAGCGVGTLSFTSQTNGGAGWTVPASMGSFAIVLPGAVTMGSAASDACQGATFTVYLTAAV
jgi:hypothetical protein